MLDQTKSIMTWETPENKTFDDEVYLNSFVLNYTLRFKGERLSQVQSITLKYGEMTTGNLFLHSISTLFLNVFFAL